ncbi:hypothetical protein B0H11DRAFT_1902361 [Mycena galericulata]|nr:hypothetical protein B0H11DRAFT_1902361 [Mycena galericulata]
MTTCTDECDIPSWTNWLVHPHHIEEYRIPEGQMLVSIELKRGEFKNKQKIRKPICCCCCTTVSERFRHWVAGYWNSGHSFLLTMVTQKMYKKFESQSATAIIIRKPIRCCTTVSERFRHRLTGCWDSGYSFSLTMVTVRNKGSLGRGTIQWSKKYTRDSKANLLLHLCVGTVPTPSDWVLGQRLVFFVDHGDLKNIQGIRKPICYSTCVSERFRHRLTEFLDSGYSFSLTVVTSKINRKFESQSAAAPVCRDSSDTGQLGTENSKGNLLLHLKFDGQSAAALVSERFRHWPTGCWYSASSFSLTMVNSKIYRKFEGQSAAALVSGRFRHWSTWCWYSASSFSLTMVNSKMYRKVEGQSAAASVCRNVSDTVSLGTGTAPLLFR